MKQDSPDQTLARLFEQQRAADRDATPLFARQCRAARPDAPRLRRPFLAAAAFLALPALALAVLLLSSRRAPESSNAEKVLVSATLISTWQPATDALLQDYANPASTTLPGLGSSWTDPLLALVDTTAAEAAVSPATSTAPGSEQPTL